MFRIVCMMNFVRFRITTNSDSGCEIFFFINSSANWAYFVLAIKHHWIILGRRDRNCYWNVKFVVAVTTVAFSPYFFLFFSLSFYWYNLKILLTIALDYYVYYDSLLRNYCFVFVWITFLYVNTIFMVKEKNCLASRSVFRELPTKMMADVEKILFFSSVSFLLCIKYIIVVVLKFFFQSRISAAREYSRF